MNILAMNTYDSDKDSQLFAKLAIVTNVTQAPTIQQTHCNIDVLCCFLNIHPFTRGAPKGCWKSIHLIQFTRSISGNASQCVCEPIEDQCVL